MAARSKKGRSMSRKKERQPKEKAQMEKENRSIKGHTCSDICHTPASALLWSSCELGEMEEFPLGVGVQVRKERF